MLTLLQATADVSFILSPIFWFLLIIGMLLLFKYH